MTPVQLTAEVESMIRNVTHAIATAARRLLLRDLRVAALLAATYASLLGVLYLFIATKEASLWQVLLTLMSAAAAPFIFFVLQALIVDYARGETDALALLKRSLAGSCRLALVSLPLILAALALSHLAGKVQPHAQWSAVTLATLRFLTFGMILPLVAIHLWLTAARDGLAPALRRARHALARALAPRAVLIYSAGAVIFVVVPYFLLFTRTPLESAGAEIGVFAARLTLACALILFGWTVTLVALAGTNAEGK